MSSTRIGWGKDGSPEGLSELFGNAITANGPDRTIVAMDAGEVRKTLEAAGLTPLSVRPMPGPGR